MPLERHAADLATAQLFIRRVPVTEGPLDWQPHGRQLRLMMGTFPAPLGLVPSMSLHQSAAFINDCRVGAPGSGSWPLARAHGRARPPPLACDEHAACRARVSISVLATSSQRAKGVAVQTDDPPASPSEQDAYMADGGNKQGTSNGGVQLGHRPRHGGAPRRARLDGLRLGLVTSRHGAVVAGGESPAVAMQMTGPRLGCRVIPACPGGGRAAPVLTPRCAGRTAARSLHDQRLVAG
jgi:hypothetical protein